MRLRARGATRVVLAAMACLAAVGAAPRPARAQVPLLPDSGRAWVVGVSAEDGPAWGWVQVRENALQGTRLRPDLAVKTLSGWDVQVARRTGRSSALGLDLASSTLDGRTTVAGPVLFNGATLAGGTPLRTRVRFPDFLRLTVLYHRVLARPGGGRIRVRGVAFWRGFGQDERSAEDGSRTRITAAGLRLTAGVSW